MKPEPRSAEANEAARDAAYRRLLATALRLDVATLAQELRAARFAAAAAETTRLPQAA